jgi:hypothetical protein
MTDGSPRCGYAWQMQQPSEEPNALASLESAYAAGDFAKLRRLAARISSEPGVSADTLERARAWRARVSVDRSAWALLAFAGLLFCAIVIRYVL